MYTIYESSLYIYFTIVAYNIDDNSDDTHKHQTPLPKCVCLCVYDCLTAHRNLEHTRYRCERTQTHTHTHYNYTHTRSRACADCDAADRRLGRAMSVCGVLFERVPRARGILRTMYPRIIQTQTHTIITSHSRNIKYEYSRVCSVCVRV